MRHQIDIDSLRLRETLVGRAVERERLHSAGPGPEITMILAHLWHAGGVREFESSTGTVGQRIEIPRTQADWGSLWQQRGRWFAIHRDDQSLIFQSGPRQWRLSGDIELQVSRGLVRRFEIKERGLTSFSLRYLFRGAAQAAIDPTYDTIDEETDDFFLYVTEMWRHWKDRSMDTFLKA